MRGEVDGCEVSRMGCWELLEREAYAWVASSRHVWIEGFIFDVVCANWRKLSNT